MPYTQPWTRRRALASLALAPWMGARVAAQSDEVAIFSAGVDVVNILATVRDKKGALVTDLGKERFRLTEDGRPQQIQYFAQLSDLPLTVGLLVDTSRSQMRILPEEQSAGKRFFDRVVDESKDQAFLINFDFEVTLVEDLTSSTVALRAALDELSPPGRVIRGRRVVPNNQFPGGIPLPGGGGRRRRPGGPGGPGGPRGGGSPQARGMGTALYDSVYLAANEVLSGQAGRKAIVLISDGVDMGSKITLEQAVEAAQRADAVVYSVYYADEDGYRRLGLGGAGRNGERALQQISEETGGRMDEVSKKLSLSQIFDQIELELRSQYSLGYVPSKGAKNGFRRIELDVPDGKYEVFTRSGYYPEGEA